MVILFYLKGTLWFAVMKCLIYVFHWQGFIQCHRTKAQILSSIKKFTTFLKERLSILSTKEVYFKHREKVRGKSKQYNSTSYQCSAYKVVFLKKTKEDQFMIDPQRELNHINFIFTPLEFCIICGIKYYKFTYNNSYRF